jgi:hypothetical protein
LLYTLKSVPRAKMRLSGVGDFGAYRYQGDPTSTVLAGARLTVLPDRRFMPYGQVGVVVLGRRGSPEVRSSLGVGVEAWVKRCLKFTTEVQIIGPGYATRLMFGMSMPVREQ